MTGKKVFTGAGEYLASFLLSVTDESTQKSNLSNTLNDITGANAVLNNMAVSKFRKDSYTREEVVAFIKEQFRKEIAFQKITGYGASGKEMSPQEITQILLNSLRWLETDTEAKFESLTDIVFDNLANIFKSIGLNNRSYNMTLSLLKQTISEFNQFALDYFVGNTTDKSRIFFRVDGSSFKVCDGAGTGASFKEVFRIKSNQFVPNQAYVGDEIIIGGTEDSSPFKSVRFKKDIYSEGDIIVSEGKHLIGTAMKARYADLAEYYTSNMEYRPGTLLQLDTNNQNEVTIYEFDSGSNKEPWCIGVVSDKPGFILNEGLETDFSLVPVVLTGRSPVRVHGKVEKGDFIYPSITHPGVAIAIPRSEANVFNHPEIDLENRIGIALESSQPIAFDSGLETDQESLINCKIS